MSQEGWNIKQVENLKLKQNLIDTLETSISEIENTIVEIEDLDHNSDDFSEIAVVKLLKLKKTLEDVEK